MTLWWRKRRELREELESHVEMAARDRVERGEDPGRAHQHARREPGNEALIREATRDQWGFRWLETLLQDLRYAIRMLRRSPGFTTVAVLTLALGIGATTGIFSVVDSVLIHPLPYPRPEQLVSLVDDLPGAGAYNVGVSEPEWQDLQRSGIFQYVSPTWYDENDLTGASQPARVHLYVVAPDYFALLEVKPQLGHAFNPEDHSPGLLPDVVISDASWKRDFGGDPHVLDKSVRLDTDLYHVIGVMPAGFHAPGRTIEERNVEIWAATNFYGPPMVDRPPRNRRNVPEAIARLKPGLTLAAAQSRVDALVAALQTQYPADYPAQSAWRVRVVPLKETVVGNVRQSVILLFGAVGLVLLIGCVNVANLLLARATSRGREMAIRHALGAAQERLTRQLLTESVLLSVLGGVAGVAILFCTKGFWVRLVPESLPRLNEIAISWSVLFFALAASLVAGVIFGLAPALHSGRVDPAGALNQEGRGSTGSRHQGHTRRVLVVTEFALSLVLMMSAGLLMRSFWRLLKVNPGFEPQNVMSIRTRLPYPNNVAIDKYRTAAQEAPFVREVLRRCRTLPGVDEAAVGESASIPLDPIGRDLNLSAQGHLLFIVEGRAILSDQPREVEQTMVTPEYFHLLRIPLLRGRFFNELDNDESEQVAVVNEAMARAYWPNNDPLGKRFKSVRAGSPWITVVGVIPNVRSESLAEANFPEVYLSLYQTGAKHLAIFLRGHLDTAVIPGEVRDEVQAVDPTLPVFDGRTLNQVVSASLATEQFSMEIVALFALAALLLSALGIYGVISYVVGERTREIAVRLALGAQRGNILRMVLREGLGLAVIGSAVGIAGAMVVSRMMTSVLYGVQPTDLATFAVVGTLLIMVGALACYIPARRAMRVDPMVALRYE